MSLGGVDFEMAIGDARASHAAAPGFPIVILNMREFLWEVWLT